MDFRRANGEEQKRVRVQQIIDATAALYDDIGYDKITFSKIASRVNFTRNLLYHYCSCKEDIFLLLLLQDIERYVTDAAQTFTEEVKDVDAFCREWNALWLRHQRMAGLFSIVNTVIRLLIAGVYLVLILLLKPTKGGSIAVVIVFSVLLVLNGVLISPLIGLGFQSAVARYGAVMMASHAALSGFVSGLVSFFTVPASILMYLSMGGYWGKTRPAPKPFVPHP